MPLQYYRRAPDATSRLVLNEAVVVRARQGDMALLNESASVLWAAADGTKTGDQLAAELARRYGLTSPPVVQPFLDELADEGLLTAAASPIEGGTALPFPDPTAYAPPATKARETLETLAATCGSAWVSAGSCNPQAYGACTDPWD